MKRPIMLLETMLNELCPKGMSVTHDIATLERRTACEGFSFLSITLPKLCDALESGLETSALDPRHFLSFRKRSSSSRLPAFMQGFFSRIFDDNGILLSAPCIDSIFAIRQITRFYKKMKVGCSPQREVAAEKAFIATELELGANARNVCRIDPILDQICLLLGKHFAEFDTFDLRCKHGPGVTADKLDNIDRFSIGEWPERCESLFPLDVHAIPNFSHFGDLESIKLVAPNREQPVKVVFVPKTATAPRVIAIEPHCMQYMQQSLMARLSNDIEKHPVTKGRINFSDQSINQSLAERSSLNRIHCTIDLSEASDRVHYELARRVFKYTPYWPFLDASRSTSAQLPSELVLKLNKFASMGSATCFPVEAYVFFALCLSAIHIHRRTVPSAESVMSYSRDLYVYGDDIIFNTGLRPVVTAYLSSYGLKTNEKKSFSKGYFRESCGADYYKGISVKPVYARQPIPNDDGWSPESILAWVSTRNQLWANGLWKTAHLLDSWFRKNRIKPVYAHYSHFVKNGVQEYPNGLILLSSAKSSIFDYNHRLQTDIVKYWDYVVKPITKSFKTLSGGLLKAYSRIGIEQLGPIDQLHRSGVLIPKRRWFSA